MSGRQALSIPSYHFVAIEAFLSFHVVAVSVECEKLLVQRMKVLKGGGQFLCTCGGRSSRSAMASTRFVLFRDSLQNHIISRVLISSSPMSLV